MQWVDAVVKTGEAIRDDKVHGKMISDRMGATLTSEDGKLIIQFPLEWLHLTDWEPYMDKKKK